MNYFLATVVWCDQDTLEAAVLIDGRQSTTLVYGVRLVPGESVVIYEDGTIYKPAAGV